jgi:hypothetical protein
VESDNLESAFKSYLDEIVRCTSGRCYWSLLHILFALPGVCAALQQKSGNTNQRDRELYESWCTENLIDVSRIVDVSLLYEARCQLFHQGRTTVPNYSHLLKIEFCEPAEGLNGKVRPDGIFMIDVGCFAEEMEQAVRNWLKLVRGDTNRYAIVSTNSQSLARPQQYISIKLSGARTASES